MNLHKTSEKIIDEDSSNQLRHGSRFLHRLRSLKLCESCPLESRSSLNRVSQVLVDPARSAETTRVFGP